MIKGHVSAPFFTVGHSTGSVAEIIELLDSVEVRLVVDVRTFPRSHRNPQFNRETLPDTLAAAQMGYEHLPALGGLRGKMPGVPDEPELSQLCGLRDGRSLARVVARLLELGRQRCAILCAEVIWWRCHRRIIAGYLVSEGETVFYILEPNNVVGAQLTPAAQHGGWSSDLSRTRVTAETGAGERVDLRGWTSEAGRSDFVASKVSRRGSRAWVAFGRRAEWAFLARSG